MRILLVHQNFPGQFLHLAPALVRRGHEVHALRIANGAATPSLWQGVRVHPYAPARGSAKGIHPWIADMETKTIRGEAAWRKARELRAAGFSPDVVYAHPGWGESLFLKEVWPSARLVLFGEFFYSPQGADMGFDPEFASADAGADHCRTQMKNLNQLSQLVHADLVISPTRWQASRFPMPWRERIEVAHEEWILGACGPTLARVCACQTGHPCRRRMKSSRSSPDTWSRTEAFTCSCAHCRPCFGLGRRRRC